MKYQVVLYRAVIAFNFGTHAEAFDWIQENLEGTEQLDAQIEEQEK